MKKRKPCLTVLALGLIAAGALAATSCGRDAIFSIIYHEVPPVPPMIRGGPTRMVVFNWHTPLEATTESTLENECGLPAEECACQDNESGSSGGGSDNVAATYRPIMFVASGSLFWYTPKHRNNDGSWDNTTATWALPIGIEQPPGRRILDIAATQTFLYALTGTGIDNTLYRINPYLVANGTGWEDVWRGNIQSIAADPKGDKLFAGVRVAGGAHEIRFVAGDATTLSALAGTSGRPLPSVDGDRTTDDTGLLTGAVFLSGIYYLSTGLTTIGTIFRVEGVTATPHVVGRPGSGTAPGTESPNGIGNFKSIIRLPDDSIIAVHRDRNGGGFLYQSRGDYFARIPRPTPSPQDDAGEGSTENGDTPPPQVYVSTGRVATSALAIWEGDGAQGKALAVGVQGSLTAATFNNGYVEFPLTDNGSIDASEDRRDATRLVSVQGQNDQYITSLGRLAINHLFQAPYEIDANRTFFASTQTAGLWSFQYRDGRYQWNAQPRP